MTCPEGCSQCSTAELAVCTDCLPGYYYNTTNVNCTICPFANCLSCNAMACLSCVQGYTVGPSLTCIQKCVIPCASCSETSPSTCLSCIQGYTYNPGVTGNCQQDLTCNSGNVCSNCPFGYSLALQADGTSICKQCNSGCARCNPNSGVCINCYKGSYLDVNTCVSCSTGCAVCSSSTTCYMCAQ